MLDEPFSVWTRSDVVPCNFAAATFFRSAAVVGETFPVETGAVLVVDATLSIETRVDVAPWDLVVLEVLAGALFFKKPRFIYVEVRETA